MLAPSNTAAATANYVSLLKTELCSLRWWGAASHLTAAVRILWAREVPLENTVKIITPAIHWGQEC